MITDNFRNVSCLLLPDDKDVDDEPDDEGGDKDVLQEDDQDCEPKECRVTPVSIQALRIQIQSDKKISFVIIFFIIDKRIKQFNNGINKDFVMKVVTERLEKGWATLFSSLAGHIGDKFGLRGPLYVP